MCQKLVSRGIKGWTVHGLKRASQWNYKKKHCLHSWSGKTKKKSVSMGIEGHTICYGI